MPIPIKEQLRIEHGRLSKHYYHINSSLLQYDENGRVFPTSLSLKPGMYIHTSTKIHPRILVDSFHRKRCTSGQGVPMRKGLRRFVAEEAKGGHCGEANVTYRYGGE